MMNSFFSNAKTKQKPSRGGNVMMKRVAIALAIAVGVFTIYQVNDTNEVTAEKVTVAFTGVNMSCNGCETQVEGALSKIIGIKDTNINPAEKLVSVTFSTKVMKAEWIENSLNAAGFHPEDFTIKPAS
jgi:copper chaperone CopZ